MRIKKSIFSLISLAVLFLGANYAGAADWGVSFDTSGNAGVCLGAACNNSGGWGLGSASAYGLPDGSIMGIITNIMNWLLRIFAILGIIGFIISGIIYLTSAGDSKQIDLAKTAMKYSIFGVLVGLSGYVIIQAVFSLLSATPNF